MSLGMDAASGRALTDMDHLRQSIAQILTTGVGTRIERRPFGSLLPQLIDQPLNDKTRIQLYAATATALTQHEPRLALTRVHLHLEKDKAITLEIQGTTYLNGRSRAVSLSVPAYQGAGGTAWA